MSALAPAADEFVHTVWETDVHGRNCYQSASWYAYVGEGPGSSYGSDWLRFYHPEDRDFLLSEWSHSLRRPERRYDVQARIRRWDGVYRRFRVAGTPLPTPKNVVSWLGYCRTLDHKPLSEPGPTDVYETKITVQRALDAYGSMVHLAAALGVAVSDLKNWSAGKAVVPADTYRAMMAVVADGAKRNPGAS